MHFTSLCNFSGSPLFLFAERKIVVSFLLSSVIAQHNVKRALAVGMHNHFKRISVCPPTEQPGPHRVQHAPPPEVSEVARSIPFAVCDHVPVPP